jgi:hypothetical protein
MDLYASEKDEFEKNKAEILKMTLSARENKHTSVRDFEIEAFRRRKKTDRFLIFGALCGILSLIGILIISYYLWTESAYIIFSLNMI